MVGNSSHSAFVFLCPACLFQKGRDNLDKPCNLNTQHSFNPPECLTDPRPHRIDRAAIIRFVQKSAIGLIPLLCCQALTLCFGHCLDICLDLFHPVAGKGHWAAVKGSTGSTREQLKQAGLLFFFCVFVFFIANTIAIIYIARTAAWILRIVAMLVFFMTTSTCCHWILLFGEAGRDRTCDLWFRRPTLYPTELQPQAKKISLSRASTAVFSLQESISRQFLCIFCLFLENSEN